ncbi:hypothetical protein QYE76_034232 [Lolium multiflorum]|uniref:CCHC-type domain-containing protein n=1 Tax=Lolium multiflorum TaxID=4521 RepID=A0AAD8R062_LOLMU|nr:hypothetical protein QYE76_034232 [Lolium multiflorum]
MENYSLLMGAAAVMKMAVEMAAVSMEKPSGALPRSGDVRAEICPQDLGFAMGRPGSGGDGGDDDDDDDGDDDGDDAQLDDGDDGVDFPLREGISRFQPRRALLWCSSPAEAAVTATILWGLEMASPINFNQFLEKEKLKSNGSNFTDWFRHVRIFLSGGNLQYVLDAPLGDPPAETETDEVKAVYETRKTRYSQVQCAILCSLESDLQKRFEHHDPHELMKELKTIFETHAAVECYEASKHFFSCMMEEGSSISEHMLAMTGHAKKLTAEIEIKKEHQVLMVNKTTSFKKQGKSKGKFKKGGKKAATPPMKPKNGPKPDAECYYCKEKGHWKRNCSKYLVDLKSGLVKKKKEVPETVPVPPTPATEEANDNDHETSNEETTEPRRSTRERATPDWYDPCLNVMIVDNNDEDPATYEEAMMSSDSNKWQEAMKSEMGSMYDNKSGYVFILNGAAVSWASSKQCTVAKSSTESEYIAASEASSEAVWMKRFIVELGVVPSALDPLIIYCDNMGAIANAQSQGHTRG